MVEKEPPLGEKNESENLQSNEPPELTDEEKKSFRERSLGKKKLTGGEIQRAIEIANRKEKEFFKKKEK